LRANLVERAEDWRWCSLNRRVRSKAGGASWLSAWPLERPRRWLKQVNTAQTEAELAALRRSVKRGCPFGEALWSDRMVRRLGLEMTTRPQGRPKKLNNS
jgi:REP-associated tyrosine transposase